MTWLVDEKSYPILKNNPYVDRVLIYDLTAVLQLQSEHFDTVINLEKVPGLCALADQITAWRRYGFRFDVKAGEAEAYDGTQNALLVCHDQNKKRQCQQYWQEHLFEMVGAKWDGEEYVFGYEPAGEEEYDVGLNYQVGNKWPSKCWAMEKWERLDQELQKEFSVSWQQGLDDMEQYFEWINSCRVLVTNDSLGMHLAIGMKKRVVAIFTSTTRHETHLYGRGVIVVAGDCTCPHVPCHQPACCEAVRTCDPAFEDVYLAVRRILRESRRPDVSGFAEKLANVVGPIGGLSSTTARERNMRILETRGS